MSDYSLKVNTIFYSIQGEGPLVGKPALFIRLSGCNLKCSWCDTNYTKYEELDLSVISERVHEVRSRTPFGLVVITGGEPCLQDIRPLVDRLIQDGFFVQIETNGTQPLGDIVGPERKSEVMVVCSPKEGTHLDVSTARWVHVWKYVVGHNVVVDESGIPLFAPRPTNTQPVYLQPMDEHEAESNRASVRLCVGLCMAHGHRLSLQVHKILGVE